MSKQRPDVIELLEAEKAYYLDQIRRINIALGALKSEAKPQGEVVVEKRQIKWRKEILNLFNEFDGLSIGDVCQKLAEKGISEALDKKYRNTIGNTTNRLKTEGKLEKMGKLYQKRKGPIETRRILFGENESASENQTTTDAPNGGGSGVQLKP
jgi:hypothetical protein